MSGYTDLTKLANNRNCLRRIARHDEPQFSKDSIVNVMEKFVKTVNVMDNTILVPCRLMDRQVGDSTDIIPAPGKDSTSNQHTLHSSVQGKRVATQSKNVHEFLHSSELFNLYNMLNALKNDLLWTGKDQAVEDEENSNAFSVLEKSAGMNTNTYGVDQETTNAKTEPTAAAAAVVNTQNRAANVNVINTNINATTTNTNTNTAQTANNNNNNNNNNNGTVKGHVRRPSTASVASLTSVSNLSDSDSDISNENDSGMESEGNKSDNAQSSADSISSSEDLHAQKNVDKATELAKRCKRHLNGLYHCLEQMTEAANYLTARYQSDIGPLV